MNAITRSDDEILFDRTMQSLEAQITSAGAHLTIDSKARLTYTIEIKRMSNRLQRGSHSRDDADFHAGRGVLFLALALSIYLIATAENKVAGFKKELAINGAGVAGGIAGGALAGLACGPAAPICVTVGAFVGGAFAALGTSYIW